MERGDLSAHRVLLVGAKTHTLQLVRAVMDIAGIGKIVHVEEGARALELLGLEHFSAVIFEYSLGDIEGVPFAQAARRRDAMLNPMIPVFVLAERARRRDVEAARDLGVTDVLTTPISPRTITSKLRAAAETPRVFIVAREFFGPDRRGKERGTYYGPDRRVRTVRKVKLDMTPL